jgi:GYF domain 2
MEIYVMRNGEQLGPFSMEDAQAQIDNGSLSKSDRAWVEGLENWKPLDDVLASSRLSVPKTESPQKQKRIGRIRRVLRAIRDFVDRHSTTKTIVVLTILLLVASWTYPPWISYYRGELSPHDLHASYAWHFIFDTTTDMRIDLPRLMLIDLIVAVPGGLLAWVISRSSSARRALAQSVFYAMLVVPILGAASLSAALIFWQESRSLT